MANLELLVTTDVRYSPTARVADYVVATKMTFETPGMTQLSGVESSTTTSRTGFPSRTGSTRRRCSSRPPTPT